MTVLFVNAAFRDGSRTRFLAEKYLETVQDDVVEIELTKTDVRPLNAELLSQYGAAVKAHDFSHSMFRYAKQFAQADEIVIAAPFWNFGLPAILHDYLELVCTQGITFDLNRDGEYYGMCKAKKLVLILTAGGNLPPHDLAIGYLRTLCDEFWKIADVRYYYADGVDLVGADVAKKLNEVIVRYGN